MADRLGIDRLGCKQPLLYSACWRACHWSRLTHTTENHVCKPYCLCTTNKVKVHIYIHRYVMRNITFFFFLFCFRIKCQSMKQSKTSKLLKIRYGPNEYIRLLFCCQTRIFDDKHSVLLCYEQDVRRSISLQIYVCISLKKLNNCVCVCRS